MTRIPANAPRARRSTTVRRLLVLLLALPALPAWVSAQEKFDPAEAKPLIGRWGHAAPADKETGEVETTVVEFLPDGRYVTTVRSTLFPDQDKRALAQGRYRVGEVDKGSMTLTLARDPGDPEDKTDPVSKMRLVRIDEDHLRADDGSVATRIK
ncbi:hypothetical protein [Pseudoxanthomonas composti]|uniref:Lipocalin-like domain-containing protein n=1 Tax=Pseudoxanthomonas composti TaxID=2137479 RepID=A0A4Q1JZG5_9GAMM|nr:hypothetical protein [Pseudoxanthomonas composti]RXR08292.1 hypothetical protein EPA99_00195 [Pseudoxanthomonas composti]